MRRMLTRWRFGAWLVLLGLAGFSGLGRAAEAPPRLVSLSPGLTEIVYAIGAADRLVGVSRQCDYPLAAKLKPKSGDFNRPDPALILGVAADLVLLSEQVREADLAPLRDAGVEVRVLPAGSVVEVLQSIRVVGELTGAVDAAHALADGLSAEVTRIGAEIAGRTGRDRPRVYLEVDGPQRLYTVGRDSFMSDLIRLAGGDNVFADRPAPYLAVSAAEVAKANPQVVLIDHPFQYKVGAAKRFGWEAIDAVREGRVYDATDFDMIVINRPGPRLVEALNELARIFHPEVFDVQKADR